MLPGDLQGWWQCPQQGTMAVPMATVAPRGKEGLDAAELPAKYLLAEAVTVPNRAELS